MIFGKHNLASGLLEVLTVMQVFVIVRQVVKVCLFEAQQILDASLSQVVREQLVLVLLIITYLFRVSLDHQV